MKPEQYKNNRFYYPSLTVTAVLVSLAALLPTTALAASDPDGKSSSDVEFTQGRPTLGVVLGVSGSPISKHEGLGPMMQIYGTLVPFSALHLGAEFLYSNNSYDSGVAQRLTQHRFGLFGKVGFHPGGYVPVLNWLSVGAKGGMIHDRRNRNIANLADVQTRRTTGAVGPFIGVDIPIGLHFTIGAEIAYLFVGDQAGDFLTTGIQARIWF